MVTFELSPPNKLMYFWTHCSATRSERGNLHHYVEQFQNATCLRSTRPAFPSPACWTSWLARKPQAGHRRVNSGSRILFGNDHTRDSKTGDSVFVHLVPTLNSPVIHCCVYDRLSKLYRPIDEPHPLVIVPNKI
jgi:hypothetical protein